MVGNEEAVVVQAHTLSSWVFNGMSSRALWIGLGGHMWTGMRLWGRRPALVIGASPRHGLDRALRLAFNQATQNPQVGAYGIG